MMHKILQRIAWLFLRTLIATYRVEFRQVENKKKAQELTPNRSFIFACWHGQVLTSLCAHAFTEPFAVLASRSKDGDYAAFVSEKMGYVAVRGSSRKKNKDKGGKEAISQFVAKLKEGISVGITMDGPKGPRHVVKVGTPVIALQAGSPIVPTIGLASSFWEFNSWDKFQIAKPFSKLTIIYGEPIPVPQDATPEMVSEICIQVAEAMKRVEEDFYKSLK